MKAKNKAKELLKKFDINFCMECGGGDQAKESALICVEEIIESVQVYKEDVSLIEDSIDKNNYWAKVLEEINKL